MAGSPNRGVIANVNSSDAPRPTTEDFSYDSQGPGHVGAIIRDPLGVPYVAWATLAAWKKTKEKYPDIGSRNNEADAYKHAIWNYLMSQSIGKDRAKAFADAHEVSGDNSEAELLMDLYNNQVARDLPRGPNSVEDALRDGKLRVSPFGGVNEGNDGPLFLSLHRRW